MLSGPELVGTPTLSGPLHLDSATPVAIRIPLTLTARATVDVQAGLGDQRCVRSQVLPAGTQTLAVPCAVTAHITDVPRPHLTVRTTITRESGPSPVVGGSSAPLTAAVEDGPPLADAVAKARWVSLAATLQARIPAQPSAAPAAFTRATRRSSAEAANAIWQEVGRSGWDSPAVPPLVRALLATRKPDGGYGLPSAWDAYDDGTVNQASTSYTITSAGQVGWVLLEGYHNGAVQPADLRVTVDAVLRTPWVNRHCLAYSPSAHDARKPCVYNVNVAAGAWLRAVRENAGYRAGEIDRAVAAIRSGLTEGYDRVTGYWGYDASSRTPQDMEHQVVTARNVEAIDPGFAAIATMMRRPWWSHPGGVSEPPSAVASSMMSVAEFRCSYARSPAVLAAAERGAGAKAPTTSALLAMAATAQRIATTCFA
jgi:hypothetical protein